MTVQVPFASILRSSCYFPVGQAPPPFQWQAEPACQRLTPLTLATSLITAAALLCRHPLRTCLASPAASRRAARRRNSGTIWRLGVTW